LYRHRVGTDGSNCSELTFEPFDQTLFDRKRTPGPRQEINEMTGAPYSVLLISVLTVAMAAYANPPEAAASEASPNAPSGVPAAPSASASQSVSPSTPQPLVDELGKLTIACGQVKVTIECVGDIPCVQTKLMLQKADGKQTVLKHPRGLADYAAASGLVCFKARDGQSYFEVQYYTGGSGTCEWEHIYTLQGKRLTRTFPLSEFDYANNNVNSHQCQTNIREISKLYKKLKVTVPPYPGRMMLYMHGHDI
jgi:hypothetical protein